jgi:hypothetical protein
MDRPALRTFSAEVCNTFAMRSSGTDSQLRQIKACILDGKYGYGISGEVLCMAAPFSVCPGSSVFLQAADIHANEMDRANSNRMADGKYRLA